MNQSNNNPTPPGNPSPNGGDPQKKKNISWLARVTKRDNNNLSLTIHNKQPSL